MRFIKIYGLQRSGTNYLEWLLKNNLPELHVLVDETGWKHGHIPDTVDWSGANWSDPNLPLHEKHGFAQRRHQRLGSAMQQLIDCVNKNKLLYCFICKNPYSWYASYARYQQFSISPVRHETIKLWCSLNHHWHQFLQVNRKSCFFIRYEDLLNNPALAFTELSRHFKLDFSTHSFTNCEHTLSMFSGTPQSQRFDSSYYINKRYLDCFSSQDLAVFANALDHKLLDILNYDIELGDGNYKQQ